MAQSALKRVPVEIRPEVRVAPKPLTVQDLPWRAAANTDVEVIESFAQKFLRVGGKLLGHALFYAQFLEFEGDTPRRTPIIDQPPTGQTIPQWLAEIEEATRIAVDIANKQAEIYRHQMNGQGHLLRQAQQELDQLLACAQAIQQSTNAPFTSGALRMVASAGGADASASTPAASDSSTDPEDVETALVRAEAAAIVLYQRIAALCEASDPNSPAPWAVEIDKEVHQISKTVDSLVAKDPTPIHNAFKHDFIGKLHSLRLLLEVVATMAEPKFFHLLKSTVASYLVLASGYDIPLDHIISYSTHGLEVDLTHVELPFTVANRSQQKPFQEIIWNILRNAGQHPQDGQKKVPVTTTFRGNQLIFQDRGAGMTPQTLSDLRDGLRVHNGERVDEGDHGIGMQSVRQKCDELGITLGIDSVMGEGTTITLTLPNHFLVPDTQNPAAAPELEAQSALAAMDKALEAQDTMTLMLEIQRYTKATRERVRILIDSKGNLATWFQDTFSKEFELIIEKVLVKPSDERASRLRHDFMKELGLLKDWLALAVRNPKHISMLRSIVAPPARSLYGIAHQLTASADNLIKIAIEPEWEIAESVDVNDLRRILLNLIHNATSHPRDGELSTPIAMQLDGNVLKVRDQGAGMSAEALQMIRDGVRIHDGEAVDSGDHGYGWQNICELCDKLDITWTIDSTPGVGTIVILNLPDGFLKEQP